MTIKDTAIGSLCMTLIALLLAAATTGLYFQFDGVEHSFRLGLAAHGR